MLFGRHKARCVAVRLLMPPVKNRTYHFHGIRLSTCGPSPCSHEAFLPISPAPQCIPRGPLARSLGTFVPVFPQARGLRPQSPSWCAWLYWVGSGRVTVWHVSPIPPLDPYVRLSPHTAHERGTFTGHFHFANS